jgi:DNA polymerase-3 subunit delta'
MIHPWNRVLWEQLPAFPRLPAVLLLCGPEGVGKRDFAQALSNALLCQQPVAAREACGRCQACRLFESGSHPDLRLVEASAAEDEVDGARPSDEPASSAGSAPARFITVGAIRALADFLALRAHFGGRKVVLVHPADRLHPAAANALLKTLEEPPSATHFLLVTGQPARLPATVRSRCVRIAFTLPRAQAAAAWLREQGAAQADLALAQAGGAPLAALALDREAYWAARKTLIDEALVQERPDPVAVVDRLGTDQLALVVGTLQRWCYDLIAVKAGGPVRYNPDRAQILHRIASRVRRLPLLALSRELQDVARWLEHPLNARLVAERCLLGYRNAITTTES